MRVVRIFSNEPACLRLVSAILKEISKEWETGKAYLAFENDFTEEISEKRRIFSQKTCYTILTSP
jgi:transposase-like protein